MKKKIEITGVALILLLNLALALKNPIGMSVEQAEFGYAAYSLGKTDSPSLEMVLRDNGYRLFVVPLAVEAVWFKSFGTGEMQLRILGWLIQVGLVWGIYRLSRGEAVRSWWPVWIATTNPWLWYLSQFHLPEALTVAGLLSSPTGLITASAIWLWETGKLLRIKRFTPVVVRLAVGAGIVAVVLLPNRGYLAKYFEPTLAAKIRPAQLAAQVNETQKLLFVASDKKFMLPAGIRKIMYNKPGFMVQAVLSKAVSLVDFEQWTAPLAAWVITGLSGLPPKGHPALIYAWDVPVLIYGWWLLRKRFKEEKFLIPAMSAMAGAMMLEKKFFHLGAATGLLLIIPGIAQTLTKLKGKIAIIAVTLLYLSGWWHFGRQMWYRPFEYRRSDAYLFREMYIRTEAIKNNFSEITVTDKFGPSPLMFAFYGRWDPKNYWHKKQANDTWYRDHLQFRSFDLTEENIPAGSAWLGLPGEFAGPSDQVQDPGNWGTAKLTKVDTGEELVHRYGQGLWILENY